MATLAARCENMSDRPISLINANQLHTFSSFNWSNQAMQHLLEKVF